MKTRVKGNRNVNKCVKLLSAEGYYVDKVEKTGRFIKVKDLFGIFDLVCLKRVGDDTKIMFVQVTSNVPHTHKNFVDFAERFGSKHLIIAQYVWIDRKGFKIFNYNNGKKLVDKGVKI